MAHILVIDDEPHFRSIFEQYLTHDGHTVCTAENGLAGLKQIKQNHFDLVITDIVMPEQDGLGLMIELHRLTDAPPVIIVTGGTPHLDQNYLLDLAKGFRAHKNLAKPVSYEQLRAAVDDILGPVQSMAS